MFIKHWLVQGRGEAQPPQFGELQAVSVAVSVAPGMMSLSLSKNAVVFRHLKRLRAWSFWPPRRVSMTRCTERVVPSLSDQSESVRLHLVMGCKLRFRTGKTRSHSK